MSTTRYVNVQRTLDTLAETLHPENVRAIRTYIDHCAAEGISEVQQVRQVQAFKTLFEKFTTEGFRLEGTTEQEFKPCCHREQEGWG